MPFKCSLKTLWDLFLDELEIVVEIRYKDPQDIFILLKILKSVIENPSIIDNNGSKTFASYKWSYYQTLTLLLFLYL